MKKQKIKFKNYISNTFFILLFSLCASVSNAMEDEEKESRFKYPPHISSQILIAEEEWDSSTNKDNPHALNSYSEESTKIIDPDSQLTESIISTNTISHSYMEAFKDNYEEESRKFLIFKCVTSLLGFGSGIPYIEAALHAGAYYGSSSLGYFLATATVLYSGGVSAWTIWELIESTRSPRTNSKICNKRLFSNATKTGCSIILGAFSAISQTYVAYKYNPTKELAIMSFVYETLLRGLGFYKFISPISCKKENYTCKTDPIKSKVIKIIDLSELHFLELHKKSNEEEILVLLKDCNTPRELYFCLRPSHSQENLLQKEVVLPYDCARGILRGATQYSALIFPLGGALVNSVLTYKGLSLIIDDTTALFILSGLSVLPALILDIFATKRVAGGIFDTIYSFKFKILPSDYFGAIHPKIKITMIATALVLSATSAAGAIYVILDNLDGTFLESSKYFFTALAAITSVKFGTYAITNTLMNLGTVLTKQFKKITSYTFNTLQKLDEVRNLITNSSLSVIRSFWDDITDKTAATETLEEIGSLG